MTYPRTLCLIPASNLHVSLVRHRLQVDGLILVLTH